MPKKTRLEKNLMGTQDVFSSLRGQSGKSGLDDDIFGFKAEAKGKKKGKKGLENSVENIYGDVNF